MMSNSGSGNTSGAAVSLNLVDAAGNTPAPVGSHFVQIAILNPASGQAASGWALASGALTVQVDSGSCGLIIPASWLYQPNSANLLPGVTDTNQPGEVTYYPSNNTASGTYFTIDALALGLNDNAPQVVLHNICVLGITTPNPPHMMGVGFCAQNIIADNPFLHAPQTPQGQPLYPSYYIDSGSIVLGQVPPPNIAYQSLTPQAKPANLQYAGIDYQCWNNPTGSLTVNQGGNNTVDVDSIAMLLDTGLDLMMVVNVPGFSQPPSQPEAPGLTGATVSVAVSDTLLNYAFTLETIGYAQFGASTPTCPVYTTVNSSTTTSASGTSLVALHDTNAVSGPAPSLVHAFQGSNSESPFLNLGFNPLFGWGMLFDAENNRLGFISVPPTRAGDAGA